jgi:hypothetical protein
MPERRSGRRISTGRGIIFQIRRWLTLLVHKHHITRDTRLYITNASAGRPWTLGRYQSYGLAKVWEGSARLPTSEQMKLEEEYWREWLGEGTASIG